MVMSDVSQERTLKDCCTAAVAEERERNETTADEHDCGLNRLCNCSSVIAADIRKGVK